MTVGTEALAMAASHLAWHTAGVPSGIPRSGRGGGFTMVPGMDILDMLCAIVVWRVGPPLDIAYALMFRRCPQGRGSVRQGDGRFSCVSLHPFPVVVVLHFPFRFFLSSSPEPSDLHPACSSGAVTRVLPHRPPSRFAATGGAFVEVY